MSSDAKINVIDRNTGKELIRAKRPLILTHLLLI